MDLYRKVRLACSGGMSQREAARHFGISRDSVRKMLSFSVPPGYRRKVPVRRPKLGGFTGIIDAWLEADRGVHRKQRHTAKRVFDRLREEHGFTGGYTIVKDYMRERERQGREMFVPLAHPPGHAQAATQTDSSDITRLPAGQTARCRLSIDAVAASAVTSRTAPAGTGTVSTGGRVLALQRAQAWLPERYSLNPKSKYESLKSDPIVPALWDTAAST